MTDTLSANAVYVPDGRKVGTGLIASVDDTTHGASIAVTVTEESYLIYTFSVFVAPGAKNWIMLHDTIVDCGCYFNVSTGAKGTEYAPVVSGVQGPYRGFATDGVTPLDFYRCWIANEAGPGVHPWRFLVAEDNEDSNFEGDGATVSAYFWGAQVELGYRPSSPVITAGAAATRLADELIQDPGATLDGYDKGTIICNVIADAASAEEGTIVTLNGDATRLAFHTDDEEHISMKQLELPG